MIPAVKQFDPVMGVDTHIVLIPAVPSPIPTPLPHPFIGMLLDPLEFVPFIGSSVWTNNMPTGIGGTAGKAIPPHIPMGGPFVKPPGNECEIFMGSATVLADGDVMSFMGAMVLSCQDIGMPPPPRPKKKSKSISLMLPTSTVLAIPAGPPVLVGGPPTISMMSLLGQVADLGLGFAMKKMGKMFRKSKAAKKIADYAHKKADDLMDKLNVSPNTRNRVHNSICSLTGHPVDIATGKVLTDAIDFRLPGPIPIVWERKWFSTSTYNGPLGHGWHHSYDWGMIVSEEDKLVVIRLPDGRSVVFPTLKVDEEAISISEKLRLFKNEQGYYLKDKQNLFYHFQNSPVDNIPLPLRFIRDASGNQIEFKYNNQLELQQIIDSVGRVIRFKNDAKGRIQEIYLPHPNFSDKEFLVTSFHFDLQSNLHKVFDAHKKEFKYEYQNHLLVKETNRNGLSFYFAYDGENEHARCTRTWGDGGIYDHKLSYHLKEKMTVVEDSLGHQTQHFYNDMGIVVKTIDAKGHTATKEFDANNQLLSQTNELGQTTFYNYDQNGNLSQAIFPDGSKIQIQHNENDLPIGFTNENGDQWNWQYNEQNLLIAKSDPLGNTTQYAYQDGNLLTTTDSLGNSTQIAYDAHKNVQQINFADGSSMQWEYDLLGRSIQFANPKGAIKKRNFDLLNQLVKTYEADGNIRQFNYDPEGNLTRIKDKQKDVQFEFGGFNRLTARIEAGTRVEFSYNTEESLTGIKNQLGYAYQFGLDYKSNIIHEIGFDDIERKYHRDAIGQIKRITFSGNKFTDLTHDLRGRLIESKHSDDSFEAFTYQANGTLIEAYNQHSKLTFEKNALGQTTKEIQGEHFVKTEYNANGFKIATLSSMGADLRFERNSVGEVTKVAAFQNDTDIAWQTHYQRDALGLEIQQSLPGGIQNRWKRDQLGRPTQLNTFSGTKEFIAKQYTWDINDQLKEIQDIHNGNIKFEHDVFGNLAWAEYPDGILYKMPDAFGNLFKSKNQNDSKYGPAGQLKENANAHYNYDQWGNLIRKTEKTGKVWQYYWNDSGMLTKVIRPDGEVVSFKYDALGRRISKTYRGRTTYWVWDGDQLLHEWTEQTKFKPQRSGIRIKSKSKEEGLIRIKKRDEKIRIQAANAPPDKQENSEPITWVFEPDTFKPIAKIVGPHTYSIVSDHLGTPTAMFNQQGDKVWSCDLNIYGKPINLMGNKHACPFRYLGQYEDVETGLYYNRFRYYAAEEGTYLSQDPIGLKGNLLNLYGYTKDVNIWVDLFGLTGTYFFTDGNTSYVGKGPSNRMNASMSQRIGGSSNATKALHVDYGDNNMGLMVEAELMDRHDAVSDTDFHNAINSPGKKKLADAKLNNPTLYQQVQDNADAFEAEYNKTTGVSCK